MNTVKKIKCAACGKRVRDSEPDLVLRKYGSEKVHYYHTRCGSAAYKRVLAEGPDVWRLTVRHVEEGLN